jgi:pilus assembly protein CpaD
MALRHPAFLAAALALAACGGKPAADIAPPNPVSSLHVDRVRVQYAAAFAPRSAELPPTEAMRIETFLDHAGLRPDDRVYIASPNGDSMAAARVGQIKALLARRGVGTVAIEPPAGLAPDHVVVLADRYVVTPPACPDWSDSGATGHTNVPNSNFGCATLNNFVLMVDNPRDLVTGRTLGPADAEPSIEAIERYHTGTVKPFLASGASSSSAASAASSPSSSSSSSSPAPSASGPGATATGTAASAVGAAGAAGVAGMTSP